MKNEVWRVSDAERMALTAFMLLYSVFVHQSHCSVCVSYSIVDMQRDERMVETDMLGLSELAKDAC